MVCSNRSLLFLLTKILWCRTTSESFRCKPRAPHWLLLAEPSLELGALESHAACCTSDQTQRLQMKSINKQSSLAIFEFIWLHYFQAFLIKLGSGWREAITDNMKESISVPQNDQIFTKNLRLVPHPLPGPNLTVFFQSLSLWWTLLLDSAIFPVDSVYCSYRTVQVATANPIQSMRWNPSATLTFIREPNTLNPLWSGHNLSFLFYLLLLPKSMPQSNGMLTVSRFMPHFWTPRPQEKF